MVNTDNGQHLRFRDRHSWRVKLGNHQGVSLTGIFVSSIKLNTLHNLRHLWGEINRSYVGHERLSGSCPPSKARTIDRPNEFQIRGWPDWLHFDAEVEQLEGAVLDGVSCV
jgi:hypothetical protein